MNLLATAVIQPRISWFHFPFPVDFGSELRGIFLLLEFRFTLRLLGKDKAAAAGFFGCPVDLWGHQKILFIVLGLTAEWQRLCAICSLMCREIPDNQHSILSALSFENHSQTRYPGSHFLYLPHLCY